MSLAAKIEPEPQLTARVKVRPKAQLTLPDEIRRALHTAKATRWNSPCTTMAPSLFEDSFPSPPTRHGSLLTGSLASERLTSRSPPDAGGSSSPPRRCSSTSTRSATNTPDAHIRTGSGHGRSRPAVPIGPAGQGRHRPPRRLRDDLGTGRPRHLQLWRRASPRNAARHLAADRHPRDFHSASRSLSRSAVPSPHLTPQNTRLQNLRS